MFDSYEWWAVASWLKGPGGGQLAAPWRVWELQSKMQRSSWQLDASSIFHSRIYVERSIDGWMDSKVGKIAYQFKYIMNTNCISAKHAIRPSADLQSCGTEEKKPYMVLRTYLDEKTVFFLQHKAILEKRLVVRPDVFMVSCHGKCWVGFHILTSAACTCQSPQPAKRTLTNSPKLIVSD